MNKLSKLLLLAFLAVFLLPNPLIAEDQDAPVIDNSNLPPPQGIPEGTAPIDFTGSQEGSTTVRAIRLTPIYIDQIKLEKGTYKAGETVNGSVFLVNRESVDQQDVYLDISLAGGYATKLVSNTTPGTIYDTKSFGPFLAKKNESVEIPFSYILPKNIGGKELGINVVARLKGGLLLSKNNFYLKEVIGGIKALDVKEAFIEVGGNKYTGQEGPTVYSTSTASFNIKVTNPLKEAVQVKSVIEIHERIVTGNLINTIEGQQMVSIPANGSRDFKISIPAQNVFPGVYVASLKLVDKTGSSRIQQVELRYIIPGPTAIIHGLNFDAKTVNRGDVINVNVGYSGPPVDIATGASQKLEGAVINLRVFDGQTNEIIAEAETPADFSYAISNSVMSPEIMKDADTIKLVATIVKDEKILAEYISSVTTPDPTQKKYLSKNLYDWIWIILAIFLTIIIGLILLQLKSKSRSNIALSLLFAMVMIGGSLVSSINKTAALTVGSYEYQNYNSGAQHAVFTSPWSNYIVKTDFANLAATISDPRCFNRPEEVVVNSWMEDSSFQRIKEPVLPNPVFYRIERTDSHYFSPDHMVAFDALFNLNNLSGNGLLYYLVADVSIKEGSDGSFGSIESLFHEKYKIPLYVYDPVGVTCKTEATSVKVGDDVTWNVTPSSGSGSYWIHWYGDNLPNDSTCVWSKVDRRTGLRKCEYHRELNKRTITVKYSSTGIKNMNVAARDSYTSSETGWKKCEGSVNVTPIEGAPILTATTSADCGGKVELSWTATPGATKYIVYRGSSIIYEGADLYYLDSGLAFSSPYSYHVVAKTSIDIDSNTMTATSSARCTTPIIQTLSAETMGKCGEGIKLKWTSGGNYNYRLYRSDSRTGVYTRIHEEPESDNGNSDYSYKDMAVDPNTVYYYKISTVLAPRTGPSTEYGLSSAVSANSPVACNNPGDISASCSVSTTTIGINQPVTWNVAATGGTGVLTYAWSENANPLSATTSSVQRSYPLPGPVNMSFKVTDSTGTSTGWRVCPATVNVTGPGSCIGPDGTLILNGGTKTYYASTTGSCSTDFRDLLCTNGTLSGGNTGIYKHEACIPPGTPPNPGGGGTTNPGPAVIQLFKINPDTVNKNNPCNIYLKVSSAQACSVTGTNINPTNTGNPTGTINTSLWSISLDTTGFASTTKQSGPIDHSTRFTLSCLGLQKDPVSNAFPITTRYATCYINPSSIEE